jgi:precorrin-6B methylase 2
MTVESFITHFIYSYLDRPKHVRVNFIEDGLKRDAYCINASFNGPAFQGGIEALPCELPLLNDGTTTVAGLCNVARKLIKSTGPQFESLLGFKGASLKAPHETSLWTKFCEIDMTRVVTRLMSGGAAQEIPDEFYKFESHFQQGLRLHNIYKVAQNLTKLSFKGQPLPTPANTPDLATLCVEHRFAEGLDFSLADLMLFAVYYLLFEVVVDQQPLAEEFPYTFKWYELMLHHETGRLKRLLDDLCESQVRRDKLRLLPNPRKAEFQNFTLNKCDPKSYKPRNRIFTRQPDIDVALNKLGSIEFNSDGVDLNSRPFDWTAVPDEVMSGSNLPAKRLERKKQQLESMTRAVLSMARPGDKIVDFCSGTGQLAILIAACLPDCQVVILENKGESLELARNRVEALKMTNVSFLQCNLDYFTADFDIGVSLHACGVATDIVLEKCWAKRARFVCSACCYGKVHETHELSYPRSTVFRQQAGLTNREFMFIAHAADQFHEEPVDRQQHQPNAEKAKQGLLCMDIVDTDRKLRAEEIGYTVLLTRMKPESCTPKNRLLIGNVGC